MKRISLALVGLLMVAGYSSAQPPPPRTAFPAPYSVPASRSCQRQVRNLCGARPRQSCLRSGIARRRFSASCTRQLTRSPRRGR